MCHYHLFVPRTIENLKQKRINKSIKSKIRFKTFSVNGKWKRKGIASFLCYLYLLVGWLNGWISPCLYDSVSFLPQSQDSRENDQLVH